MPWSISESSNYWLEPGAKNNVPLSERCYLPLISPTACQMQFCPKSLVLRETEDLVEMLWGSENDLWRHGCTSSRPVLCMCVFQALVGLSRCDTVKQIVSKLPLFNSAQLQRRLCFLYCLHSVFFLIICLAFRCLYYISKGHCWSVEGVGLIYRQNILLLDTIIQKMWITTSTTAVFFSPF